MIRRIVVCLLSTALLSLAPSVDAQPPGKIPRIGILFPSTDATTAHLLEAFKQGLRELGYVEKHSVLLESRYGEAKAEQLPVLANELVRLKVDVIVAVTNSVIEAVNQATQTIPIVTPNSSEVLLPAWLGPVETSRG